MKFTYNSSDNIIKCFDLFTISISIIIENSKIKKASLIANFTFMLVTRTGFEPVNACVKGM